MMNTFLFPLSQNLSARVAVAAFDSSAACFSMMDLFALPPSRLAFGRATSQVK